ncbi:MAG: tetratricopeptide repeat protein [Nitrosopumilus sp. D6]|nr:MAG: tetratricopeptide repeat protein [Nitrosopumilus sp. D6]
MTNTNRRILTDALRWQKFKDIMYAFFDLERLLYMKDSKMYQTEIRHMRKYIVISLVIVVEQFCREIVKVQAEEAPVRTSVWKRLFGKTTSNTAPEIDVSRNFQNIPIITRTLGRYGITGIFDGDNGTEMKKIMEDLISARHDAVHTVTYPLFDVMVGYGVVEELFRRILDLSVLENSSNIDIAKAGYELNIGNQDEAAKIMRGVIHMIGKSHNIMYNKSIAWNTLQMHERAVECLDDLAETRPNDRKILIQLGHSLGNLGNRDEEIKCYTRILQLQPNDVVALSNLCITMTDLGRKEEADSYLEKMHAMKLENPMDFFYKGLALGTLERHKEALECFEQALGMRPGDPNILFSKGAALVGMERYEESLDCFDAVLEAWHGNKDVLLAKAGTLEILNRHKESAESRRLAESWD